MVAAIAVALASAYVGLAGTLFLAAWFGERAELTSLQRAVRFDPGNANYRNHLGRYYELVARDPAAAIGPYTEAVRLNPHSARFWFDLASAYQVRGDVANQTAALEHAIEADPTTPDVAWEAANLYLVQGLQHSAGMLMVYLPAEKILINADLYSPTAPGASAPPVSASMTTLYRNIQRLKLDVSQHVPIHGNPSSNADFERTVGPAAARARPSADALN